jgi:hypothetical protein
VVVIQSKRILGYMNKTEMSKVIEAIILLYPVQNVL